MKKFLGILLLFVSSINCLKAQEEKERLIQFTGRIFNEFLQPLPFTHIVTINGARGTITDREGKFSFIVLENDTILFSTMGYKKSKVIIPMDLEKPFFTRDVLLDRDTIMIAEIEVYPWKDYEDFKEAFINLELPEDDMDRARRNIALIKTQIILENSPSASENFDYVMQQQLKESFNRGTHPTYQILNPFAWGKFFQAIKRGDFKNWPNE